ncbi:hypothetical protein ACFPL7_03125 [Dongia soli]|uniref:Secreted protein n=1 Tax=Dongia soli TaxID=600628 RepID=A0ABU5EH20_9PROT|nr:hypothetical protein [Dongia soli]MDY0884718.1 hypothetical protein [Dongia soli]
MFVRTDRRMPALKSCRVAAVLGLALSLGAFAVPALADDDGSSATSLTRANCQASLPALERSGISQEFGHLQALKMLERCNTLLGQDRAATFAGWLIDRELDRPDPHDQ